MKLLFLVGLALQAAPDSQCSVDAGFLGPAADESIAIATATGRTEWVAPAILLGSAPLDDPYVPVLGYELVVTQATPSSPIRPGTWRILAPRDTVIAVPWSLNPECEVTRFSRDEWVPAGGELVIRVDGVRLHERRRVVDVVGSMNGFPYSTHTPPGLRTSSDRATWLSTTDFFHLLSTAPTRDSELSPAEQLRGLENTYRGGPMYLIDRFPGPQMLEWARRWARAGNGS